MTVIKKVPLQRVLTTKAIGTKGIATKDITTKGIGYKRYRKQKVSSTKGINFHFSQFFGLLAFLAAAFGPLA